MQASSQVVVALDHTSSMVPSVGPGVVVAAVEDIEVNFIELETYEVDDSVGEDSSTGV